MEPQNATKDSHFIVRCAGPSAGISLLRQCHHDGADSSGRCGLGGLIEYLSLSGRAGVRALPFNSTQGKANRFQLNFRNHRKIVVVDGQEAWVGGLNIGDEYRGLDPKFGYWRDTHLRLSGPIVPCVQVAFLEDWQWASHELLRGLNWDPRPAASGISRAMACLPSGPADPLETCTLFFLQTINLAQKRLWIASPNFVPDEHGERL